MMTEVRDSKYLNSCPCTTLLATYYCRIHCVWATAKVPIRDGAYKVKGKVTTEVESSKEFLYSRPLHSFLESSTCRIQVVSSVFRPSACRSRFTLSSSWVSGRKYIFAGRAHRHISYSENTDCVLDLHPNTVLFFMQKLWRSLFSKLRGRSRAYVCVVRNLLLHIEFSFILFWFVNIMVVFLQGLMYAWQHAPSCFIVRPSAQKQVAYRGSM